MALKQNQKEELIVNAKIVTKNITTTKANESPGVEGIPTKLAKKAVEQIIICLPLATDLNLSLKEEEGEKRQYRGVSECRHGTYDMVTNTHTSYITNIVSILHT